MNNDIRVLIVDDEPRARRGVQLLLGKLQGFEIVGEAGNGDAALAKIHELKPDLVFLDVQMPGLSGFEVLERIPRDELPAVIFVTAYDDYAIKAFSFHAIDYLLKPIDDERFNAAVEHARRHIGRKRVESLQTRLVELLETLRSGVVGATGGMPAAPTVSGERAGVSGATAARAAADNNNDRIVLKNGAEVILLRADEVDWIEADGDYMKFHTGGKSLLQRETMASLAARLDPKRFRRIHRSTIVNLDRIARVTPAFNGDHVVVLKDGTKLKLSKGYHDHLQEWLRQGS